MALALDISFGRRKFVAVETLAEARAQFIKARDAGGHGASAMSHGCGDVIGVDGKLAASISYNGRVWDPAGSEVKVEG